MATWKSAEETMDEIKRLVASNPMGSLHDIANFREPFSGMEIADIGFALREIYDVLRGRMEDLDVLPTFEGADSE